MADNKNFHPALAVNNIKNFIPITLEMETNHYSTWVELFKTHCTVYQVIDHIIPTTPETESSNEKDKATAGNKEGSVTEKEKSAKSDKEQWSRLDAIVRQWIYGTISIDLLHTIMSPGSTAQQTWERLENIFQDNKASRAVHLENQFTRVHLDDFPNISAYCQELKMIADQLSNVGSPVSNQRLVLQLIAGLNENYDGVAIFIQQSNPLPLFHEARSRLILEETRKAKQAAATANAAGTALLTTNQSNDDTSGHSRGVTQGSRNPAHRNNFGQKRGQNKNNNRGRNGGGRGRGRSNNNQNSGQQYNPRPWQQQQWPSYPQWGPWGQQPWAAPPCPYPTSNWVRPPSNRSPVAAGTRPPQAYSAHGPTPSNYAPTDIDAAMQNLSMNVPDENWYMDTGATAHMTASQGTLSTYSNLSINKNIVVGSGQEIPIRGYGQTHLSPPYPPLSLNNVLHAPKLIKNLISVRRFTIDNNVTIEFDPFGFSVKDIQTGMPLMRCDSTGDLYPLTTTTRNQSTSPATFAALSPTLWHNRLGHPGSNVLSFLSKNKFIECKQISSSSICQSCIYGKHVKLPFSISNSNTSKPFDIIHSDLWTSPILSSAGHKYYLFFLDDYTNFVWTFPIGRKSQVPSIFSSFHAFIKTQFGTTIKCFQCDNGREFNNEYFTQFCHKNGMVFRFSCPHTSPQNGKAERKIRAINNFIRTSLAHSSMPPSFWHHALQITTYLQNILPSKILSHHSPTQYLYHKDPSYTHLRVFGCLCYPLFPSTTINKLQARSTPCAFLGYPQNHRGYKCYDLSSKKIIISRHVIFDETQFPFAKIHTPSTHTYEFLNDGLHPILHYHLQNDSKQDEPEPPTTESPQPAITQASPINVTNQSIIPSSPILINPLPHPPVSTELTSPMHTPQQIHQEPTRTMATRSMHGIHKPKTQFNLTTSITPSPLPHNPKAALSDPNWKAAMLDEFDALIKNKTWELVPRPQNVNVIRSMWIFRHKKKSDGSFERYKARLVGDGRSQQVGLDCDETFSPVVKPTTIRIVLTIALSKSWSIHQLDVKNAFLHGELQETVYMHQPMGFRDPIHPDYVCLLKKSLYGLKQAPRAWYQRFADFALTIGFSHSKSDHSLFIYRKGNDMAYILLYVDDIILTASSDALRQSIMSLLASEFAMKDLGTLSYFLGLAVTHHAGGLFLSQRKYASEIIERAGMTSCKPTATPVDTKSKLSTSSGSPYKDPTHYRRLAGALQYLTFTRPDISYAVQQVCLHMHDPKDEHMNALKRILRYLQGTLDHGLHLYKSSVSGLISYTDADWGGCPDTRRSTSGYCIFLGDNLISWSSKRQPTLSRSSAEAEYRGVANVVSESCWIRNLLLELHCPIPKATLVHCDNISAIYLSGNPVQHQRTKHIEMDIHFVREKVSRGQVRVLHVPSRYQIADIFTKGLPRILFEDFRDSLSIRRPPASTAGVC